MQNQNILTTDMEVYDFIVTHQKFQLTNKKQVNNSACFLHSLLKAIPLLLIYFKFVLTGENLLSDQLIKQLVLIFVIIDFWFTKNYNGRKMIGIKWFIKQQTSGIQKFYYQFRVNDQHIGSANAKTFWIVLIFYAIFPILYYYVIGFSLDAEKSLILDMILLLMMLLSAIINLFMFHKASLYADRKKKLLKKKLGVDFVAKFGFGSGLSYV